MTATTEEKSLGEESGSHHGHWPKLVAGDRGLFAINIGKQYGNKPVVRTLALVVSSGQLVTSKARDPA